MKFDPTYNPFSLAGKSILITGASSGIGRATAIECSKLGAICIITGRNEERLNETLAQMTGEGHQIAVCDLNNSSAIDVMVDSLPILNGLINNAGLNIVSPVQFIKEDDLKKILQTNTIAPIILLQKLLKKKKITKGSSVVFTSSLAGIGINSPGNDMYSATKGAISAFVRNAALDLAPKKIRVNAVCPGMVHTQIVDHGTLSEEQLQENMKKYPLGRWGEPNDVAHAMIYLLSDASSWVTGTNMILDGGVSIK